MLTRASLWAWLLALCCSLPSLAQTHSPPPTLTVGAGDTATALALQLRPEGATLEQTLVALWRANPQAFGQGSLNQLLQGATLRVPSKAEVLRTAPAQAHALVVEQVDNFQAYARQQSRPAASSAASTNTTPALDAIAWRRALAEAQALKEALEKQSRETQTRLAQLEKNIQTLQGLQASANAPATPPASAPESTAAPAASVPAAAASSVASEPVTAQAAASEASGPESVASQAGASASEPTAIASETNAAHTSQATPTLPALPLWVWWTGVGAVVVLMWALTRRRTDTAVHPRPTPEIPPQMARINLDLDSPPSGAGQDTRP